MGALNELDEEEPQSRSAALDRAMRQLPIADQMHLALTNVAWTKAFGRGQ
jgi:hypothetical protein